MKNKLIIIGFVIEQIILILAISISGYFIYQQASVIGTLNKTVIEQNIKIEKLGKAAVLSAPIELTLPTVTQTNPPPSATGTNFITGTVKSIFGSVASIDVWVPEDTTKTPSATAKAVIKTYKITITKDTKFIGNKKLVDMKVGDVLQATIPEDIYKTSNLTAVQVIIFSPGL